MSGDIESVIRDTLVTGVNTRQVGAKQTTIWDIATQGGPKMATFQAGIGNKALALVGQVCDLRVRVEQNGDFTNYMLLDVQLSGKNAVVTAAANAAAAAPQEVTFETFKSDESDREQRKNQSIHRQCATKVAATLLPQDSAEFWANVTDLVKFYATGLTPFEIPTSSVTSHTAPAADALIPEDDIPF